MTRWAIGDVQGCMTSLERLLARIAFDPARDHVWLVGDLVNRGPRSLDVLRWAVGLGDRVTAVLGNHDLHLLGRVAGTAKAKKRDTLDEVLAARDRDALIDWLRARPLCHVEDGLLLVHAGLHPSWSASDARAIASALEVALRGPTWRTELARLLPGGGPAPAWTPGLPDDERARAALAIFTRVRMCSPTGVPDPDFDGAPDEAPPGLVPWFELAAPRWRDHRVVFGHWAALGLHLGPGHHALDSGCVWGGRLTAFDLDARRVVQVDATD